MVLGAEIKARNGAKPRFKGDAWSCGCTILYCPGEIEAECLKCGNGFVKVYTKKKTVQVDKPQQAHIENVIELNAENNPPDAMLENDCGNCNNEGWIKAYTQEWDRIKCHHAPCPKCHSGEWMEWSANKKLILVK